MTVKNESRLAKQADSGELSDTQQAGGLENLGLAPLENLGLASSRSCHWLHVADIASQPAAVGTSIPVTQCVLFALQGGLQLCVPCD